MWLLFFRIMYVGLFYVYITSEPPILHLSAAERQINSCKVESAWGWGWECVMCDFEEPDIPSMAWSVAWILNGHQKAAISNKRDLSKGMVVWFTQAVPPFGTFVQCRPLPMPQWMAFLCVGLLFVDFCCHVGIFPNVELLTYAVLGLIGYKAFHFAFAF